MHFIAFMEELLLGKNDYTSRPFPPQGPKNK